MSAKHFKIIALQSVFTLFVFLLLVYFFVKYDSDQLENQVNNTGKNLAFAIQEDVNISEGVLASFAYNYEIDPDLDEAKFKILAKHYINVNPEIIYLQLKDKETTTIMVYPDTFNYTLGATLIGRPEVEEAVLKAIKNKIITANAPYVLKDTDDLLGLVIRYPLYHEETFNGFFVVVMNIDNFLNSIINAEIITDYNISIFDDNKKLFWGYDGHHNGHVYINKIDILDNFWTIQVSTKNNIMASTLGFVIGTSILFLLVVGLLFVIQIKLLKKDQNIQHLIISKIELEKVKESHTLALDSANDALWEWNIITNEIYTSDKWEEINGYEKCGKGIDVILQKEFIHTEDYEQSVLALEACLRGEKQTFDIKYRIKNPSGKYSWVQNRGKVYIDDRGDANILAGSISNITERKQTENELQRVAEELEQQRKDLEKRLLQSVNAISKIGELRDVYTAGHQKRVSELVCSIGREMGLTNKKISNLSYGALLHDVGKFFIPSDILNKPGKVSDLEYKILQTHVEESYNVVKEIDFSEEIHTMIYQHHERLDGSGYPQGLSGDEIILESRILAVADVVEAMSSHRPYRSALGIDTALEEIELHKGTRFDTDIVDICIRLFREKKFQFYDN